MQWKSITIQLNVLIKQYKSCYIILFYLQHVSAQIEPSSGRQNTQERIYSIPIDERALCMGLSVSV